MEPSNEAANMRELLDNLRTVVDGLRAEALMCPEGFDSRRRLTALLRNAQDAKAQAKALHETSSARSR